MSYILDALKRAESERKLGSIPGMHAQSLSVAPAERSAALWRRPLVWVMCGAAVVALSAWLTLRPHPEEPAMPGIAPTSATAMPAPEPARTIAAPEKIARAELPPPPPYIKRLDAPPAVAKVSKAERATERVPAIANGGNPQSTALDKKTVQAAHGVGAARGDAGSSTVRAPALRELPDHIRRSLPAVAIGGYIYSGNPTDRSVMINNRLLREGDQVAPGLTLEQMMPKEAVLNFQGTRYRISY